jgi:sipW-cognate class signal peptide
MNNKRATKRALLTSVTALAMCVVMLVGTTFAWFTDTASTGVNKIQAGNLKMEVTYKNAETLNNSLTDTKFEPVTKETSVFNNNAFWEPGHVEFAVLNVKNIGTLALKYKLGINIASETGSTNVYGNKFELSNYIKFAVIDGDQSNLGRDKLVAAAGEGTKLSKGYTPTEEHLLKGENKIVTLVVWMPTTVGNEANYKVAEGITAPSIDLGINVVATQYTYEKDSFDEKYDEDAAYPVVVSNQEQVNDAITNAANKKATIVMPANTTFTLDSGIAHEGDKSRDITFVGDGSQTIDIHTDAIGENGYKLNYQRGSTFVFENLNIKGNTSVYEGIVAKKLTYKNCTLTDMQCLYGEEVEFINCTFNQTANDSYHLWTYGAKNVTFTGCTFNSTSMSKAVLCYTEQNEGTLVRTFNNCTFKATGVAEKSAIMVNPTAYSNVNTYIVNINNCTATGYGENGISGQTIVGVKGTVKDNITITIDGATVYTNKA